MRTAACWIASLLILLTVIIGLALAFIDEPLRAYAEREMNRHLDGYTVKIGGLDFHPVGLSIDFENVLVFQDEYPDPPIAEIPRWHASIHWRSLLSGRLVSDHAVDRPVMHVTLSQAKKEAKDEQPLHQRGWQEAVLAIYPLKINVFEMANANITYLDRLQSKPLQLRHLNMHAENIRNIQSQEGAYPSTVHVDGDVFESGRLKIDGSADFLSEPHLGIKVEVVLEEIKVDDVLPVTGRFNVHLRRGWLSAKGHVEYSPFAKEVKLTDLLLDGVRLDYVHAATTAESEKHLAQEVAHAAEKASNHPDLLLRIDRGKILNSEIGFVNQAVQPAYRVFLTDTNIGLENFSNQFSEGTAYIKLSGKFMGSGLTQATGTFRPEQQSPDFDLHVRLVNARMRSLNDVLRAYRKFDVANGVFSLFTELRVKDGRINGYIKPLFKDVDVYNVDQDRDKEVLQKLYEGIMDDVTATLKNAPRDEVATKAAVSGPVKHPKMSTWEVVAKLIQNAFFKAILPGFEKK